jgi:hypothetical protein
VHGRVQAAGAEGGACGAAAFAGRMLTAFRNQHRAISQAGAPVCAAANCAVTGVTGALSVGRAQHVCAGKGHRQAGRRCVLTAQLCSA